MMPEHRLRLFSLLRPSGARHSINEAGTTLPTERWYGSEKIVDQWLEPTLQELKKVEA